MTNKLSEVDSVEQIVESKEWKEFYKNLFIDPPQLCKDFCAKDFVNKIREKY
jgi:hypothetical protein